ncbi:xylulokinase [Notoacmeibacter marinus]|uniref:xylulokinase n=1 Tax=Notoacmeibacter marinus TaxID=1876515 RepID=UPI000DF373BB|nr:FGGY-family carbohydrate kinase [Notoacmeibacter marinus]
MDDEFVIGVDSSTQMTKAVAWSRTGEALGEGRAPVEMSRPQEGWFEQDPENWWSSFCEAVRQLGQSVDLTRAAALSLSNQRETIGFLDADGKPVRPGMVWLDERAAYLIDEFADRVGAEKLHAITGKPVDVTPPVYRMEWLRRHEPDMLAKAAKILDVNAYLTSRLSGKATASWTSADPSGVFDLAQKRWSPDVLDALGLDETRFASVVAPGCKTGTVTADAAGAAGLPQGLTVIAGGGDGQCAGLGGNAVRQGTAYLNLGTAIIVGAWSREPRVSKSWRTMSSPTGDGYFLEGVLRAGTFFVDWFVRNVARGTPDAKTFAELTEAAARLPIGSEGLLVSPYLSGCMNPHWSMDARAAFFGMTPQHEPGHLYRAVLEALTGEIARSIRDIKAEGVEVDSVVAVGGGAVSDFWLKMIADASGVPVQISSTIEASSLGAAITAAVGLGWYSDFDSAAAAMTSTRDAQEPSSSTRAQWDALLERQDALNRIVVEHSRSR